MFWMNVCPALMTRAPWSCLRPRIDRNRDFSLCWATERAYGMSTCLAGASGLAGWQFQSDAGTSPRDDPNLGHAQLVGDRRHLSSKIFRGLARQQVDLDPGHWSSADRYHLWSARTVCPPARVYSVRVSPYRAKLP